MMKKLFIALWVIPWAFVAGALLWPSIAPDSFWIKGVGVHVADSTVGEDPVVLYRREIVRPFTATWVGQIRQVVDGGQSRSVCWSDGEGDYDPSIAPPPNLRLSWFTYPHACSLMPGRYYVHSAWTIHLPLGSRVITFDSNVFTVRE